MASVYCASCNGIPRDCVDSDCCAQIYCWNCVVNGVKCSFCGNPVDPAKCKENLAVRRIVNSLPKNCRYEGCSVVLPGDKMKDHEPLCEFKPCICPNSELCGIFLARELKDHQVNDCEYRTAECAFKCGAVMKAKDFQAHVSQDCPEITVQCNNMCNTQLKRGNMAFHMQNECPFQPTPCEFAEYGCTKAVLKIQYDEHMETDMKNHFVLLSKAVKNQSSEIKELKQKVTQISNSGRPLVDAELVNNGVANARVAVSSTAQFIGQSLEAARLKGMHLYANRASIGSSTKKLLETSRLAQFGLFLFLYTITARLPMTILFMLFLATTGMSLTGMVLKRNSFAHKMIKIAAWACILGLIFHAQPTYHHQHHNHYTHHQNRRPWN